MVESQANKSAVPDEVGNPEAIPGQVQDQAGAKNKESGAAAEGGNNGNENSAMSSWSSSNSDSDDFNNEQGREGQTGSRSRRGQGSRSRRRRSPGSPYKAKTNRSGSDERKEYESPRKAHRSRSRDNSADLARQPSGAAESGQNPDAGSEAGGHHTRNRRERSNGSHASRNSSQDRNDGRRRGSQRRDAGASGAMGSSSRNPHNGQGGMNQRGRGGKREGGEYMRNGFFFPSMSKPLVSLQQFSSLQNRQSDPYNIRQQYKNYQEEHKQNHASAFWKEHEKEPWFMETYNPMTVYQAKMDQQELVRQKAQKFFASLPIDLLDLTKREDALQDGPQLHKFDPNNRTIYLKQIPVFVARVMLKAAVSSVTQGLEQIILSRPLQMHNFERFAWLVYGTEEQSEASMPDLETLVIRAPSDSQAEDFQISPIRNNQSIKPPKVTPEMPLDHLPRDISLCKRLIEVFDTEKDIQFPFDRFDTVVESEDAKLDTLLLYLRQVHGYCLFCGIRCADERSLIGKCASQHLRLPPSVDRVIYESSALYGSARIFEHNYVTQAEKIITNGPEEKPMDPQEDEILVEMKNQYCLSKTKEVTEGKKYVCRICDKAFKSTEFVVKHIKNKHEDRLLRQNYSFFKKEARENFLKQLQKTPEFQQQSTQGGRDPGTFSRQGSYGGGYGGNRGGDSFQERGYRGGRGGGNQDFMGSSDRPPYNRHRSTGPGAPFMGNQQPQAAMEDGQVAMDFDGAEKKKPKEQAYIDYDDPTQFDGQGQRLPGHQTQLQQQFQQQQQMSLYKQGAAGQAASADRQLVSYDDLF